MKRNLTLIRILALVLCLGLLAGCGGGAASTVESAVESAASAEVSAAAPVEEETAPAEKAPVAEEPSVVEEVVEPGWEYTPISYPMTEGAELDYWLIWELSPDTIYNDISEHVQLAYLEEHTGVHLNVLAQSQAAGQTNTDLMIASGDYPDLIGGFSYSTGMDAAIEDEVVVNIKEDISTYAPDYYKYLIENDYELWKAVQTDEGNIGAFVAVGAVPEVSDGMMVFQFMLDEQGFDVESLKTIQDYEDYLTACKNAYGMSSPLYLPGDFMLDGDSIASAYGVSLKIDAISGDLPWTVVDGEVKFGYLEQGFVDYVTLMNKWYNDGLIDSDTASHPTEYKNDDQIGLIANKQLAVFNRGSGLIDLFKNLSGEVVVPAYAPVLNEGDQLHIGGPVTDVSGEGGLVITTGCEDLELAMNFCNYLYTDEFIIPANYGVEGDTYTIDENGEPQFAEWTYSTQGRTFSSVMMDYQLFIQVDANVVTPGQSEAALSCDPIWSSNLDSANDYPAAAAMNLDESDQYTQRAGDILTICQEYTTKFITGEYPLDEIEAFQQKLVDTGIQDCIDAKQSAYDRYMARG